MIPCTRHMTKPKVIELKVELKLCGFLRLRTSSVCNKVSFVKLHFMFAFQKYAPLQCCARKVYLQSVSSRADSHAASERRLRWGGYSGHTNKGQTKRGSREKGTRELLSQGKGPASWAFQPLPHAACWLATAAFVAVVQNLYNLN